MPTLLDESGDAGHARESRRARRPAPPENPLRPVIGSEATNGGVRVFNPLNGPGSEFVVSWTELGKAFASAAYGK